MQVGINFLKRIRFAPCLFVGSEYTFILFWQAFSCSHQFFICPYFPLHSHCCQLIHNFLYTQYIHINKSIFATKRLSVNNSGTLCQGENCLIKMFNLVIYYCYTATNFLFTCIIISLSRLFQKISLLYICSDLYFYYSLFGTGLIFGSLEQVGSLHYASYLLANMFFTFVPQRKLHNHFGVTLQMILLQVEYQAP